jgi:hypothetical protein
LKVKDEVSCKLMKMKFLMGHSGVGTYLTWFKVSTTLNIL